ncbi:sulfatase-like hydrolase/transferase [Verrucomicrobia bacterium]|nr:sulfatase-like hydrolase/transferase [Verrucomicrobiota bacterium]
MVNSAINQSILPLVDQSLKNKLGCFSFVLCFLATVSVNVIGSQQERYEAKVPNIIIIYADDLGIGDLSCYNPKSSYITPRLDHMAAEGIRFLDAHSPSTICSPSRYGLYSGQQIYRSTGRGGGAFEGPGGPSYLKPGTLTLGDMLKQKGYHTGVFGKWHVGLTWFDKEGERLGGGFDNSLLIDYDRSTPLIDGPNARGFDASFVTPNCPTTDPLYIYIENGMVPIPADRRHLRSTLPNPGGKWRWDNDEGWMAPGYDFLEADLMFYEKTEKFIVDHLKKSPEKPFFTVFSTQIAHAPVLPAPEFVGNSGAGPRGDFVVELDTLVGRVIDLVKELGIDDETLILFNADNGAETMHVDWMREDHDHDPSAGLRGMKRDAWEGGHRVPFIARWPGRIPQGQVSDQITNTTDIFATLASIVDFTLPDDAAVDSFDMLPVMTGKQDPVKPVRPHLLTQSFRGEFQIRKGKWKYLDHQGSGGNNYERGVLKKYEIKETAPEAPGQLYDLAADPQETINLYFKKTEVRRELQALLQRLKQEGRSAPVQRKPVGFQNIAIIPFTDAQVSK